MLCESAFRGPPSLLFNSGSGFFLEGKAVGV